MIEASDSSGLRSLALTSRSSTFPFIECDSRERGLPTFATLILTFRSHFVEFDLFIAQVLLFLATQ